MAKTKKAGLEAKFKHNTSIGEDGAILYDAPIQIRDQADLENYNISWGDCRTLNFHGSERVTVFFMKVESRALAEYMWASLDTEHSRGYASVRCMIPGKRKAYIKCPDTNSCAKCPHKGDKQAPVISLDGLVESGYDPAAGASPEENAVAKSEYRSIKAVMDGEDIRISKAFERDADIAVAHQILHARACCCDGRSRREARGRV